MFLDLGEHRLLGSVPTWIGENLQNLMILALKYNEFNGSIPLQLCQLKYLNIASNNLSRTIPRCAFIDTSFRDTLTFMYLPYKIYYNYIFQHVFPLAKSLDLSSSKLTRQIPKEVMSLVGLKNLNLSTNHLVRPIPPNIAEMRELESLDLSRNHLSFTIPPDMTNLTFIVVLDVSHNNLSGVILCGLLLNRFHNSSYTGNPQLCGIPLSKISSSNKSFGDPQYSNEKRDEKN